MRVSKAATETEAGFMAAVIALAKLNGFRVYHQRPAWTRKGMRTAVQGDAGYPDLTLARAGRVIFAELKVGTNTTTPAQDEWLAALGGVVWRPEMWSEIAATLKG